MGIHRFQDDIFLFFLCNWLIKKSCLFRRYIWKVYMSKENIIAATIYLEWHDLYRLSSNSLKISLIPFEDVTRERPVLIAGSMWAKLCSFSLLVEIEHSEHTLTFYCTFLMDFEFIFANVFRIMYGQFLFLFTWFCFQSILSLILLEVCAIILPLMFSNAFHTLAMLSVPPTLISEKVMTRMMKKWWPMFCKAFSKSLILQQSCTSSPSASSKFVFLYIYTVR